MSALSRHTVERVVHIPSGPVLLTGSLFLPDAPKGLVLFAHGSGSGRRSPRGSLLSEALTNAGFATLLFDLLTASEQEEDQERNHLRFNIPFLTERIKGGLDWAAGNTLTRTLGIGIFGGSTGSSAALAAAADRPLDVQAVVSRGGRTDLVTDRLKEVVTPTLLVVGDQDVPVVGWNQEAFAALSGPKELYVVPGATHLFPEPGALLDVARVAIEWFDRHLRPSVLPQPDRTGRR